MLRQRLSGCIALWFLLLSSFSGHAFKPLNFAQAKSQALILFGNHRVTLYCQCAYNADKKTDLASCNMQPAQVIERAHRIEWEHIMPAARFGQHRACWQQPLCNNQKKGETYKGRKCCEKIDDEFKSIEAELYNLWPAVGLVNQARSDFEFGYLFNKRGFFGCAFDVDPDLKIAEPPDPAKGIVARANLFMADHYHLSMAPKQRELFNQWNKEFPPDAWEISWAKSVEQIEGYKNPYIQG